MKKMVSLITLSISMLNLCLHTEQAEEIWYEKGIKHTRVYEIPKPLADANERMLVHFLDAHGNQKDMSPKITETIGQIKDFLKDQGYLQEPVHSDNILLTLHPKIAPGIVLKDNNKTIVDYITIEGTNNPQRIAVIVTGKKEPVYLKSDSENSQPLEKTDEPSYFDSIGYKPTDPHKAEQGVEIWQERGSTKIKTYELSNKPAPRAPYKATLNATTKALLDKVINSGLSPEQQSYFLAVIGISSLTDTPVANPLNAQDRALLDSLLTMKGATPHQIEQMHLWEKPLMANENTLRSLPHKVDDIDFAKDLTLTIWEIRAKLSKAWEKVAQPLLSDLYNDLYYQALAEHPDLADRLPKPERYTPKESPQRENPATN